MFDSPSFEQPPMSVEPTSEKTDVSVEELGEIVNFFEKKLEEPQSKWILLMADAQQNGAWDVLAHELNEDQGTDFTGAQLETAMEINGGHIFREAVKRALEEDDSEDVDVGRLDKAA